MLKLPEGWKITDIRISGNCLDEITPGNPHYNSVLTHGAVNCTYYLTREISKPPKEITFEQFSKFCFPENRTTVFVTDLNKYFKYNIATKSWEEEKQNDN